eukprot:scaffold9850_cov93-Isochrysis_galbana.AAC.2
MGLRWGRRRGMARVSMQVGGRPRQCARARVVAVRAPRGLRAGSAAPTCGGEHVASPRARSLDGWTRPLLKAALLREPRRNRRGRVHAVLYRRTTLWHVGVVRLARARIVLGADARPAHLGRDPARQEQVVKLGPPGPQLRVANAAQVE